MPYSDPMTAKLVANAEAAAITYVRACAWTIAAHAQAAKSTSTYGVGSNMTSGSRNRAVDALIAEQIAQRMMYRAAFELSKTYDDIPSDIKEA
jgi:hypothetical protein